MENFLVHYGWSEKILTDQGKSFENSLIRELCELVQVKKLRSSPFHPEINGQREHFDATLINMMGTLPTLAKKNWQEWIATLTHAHNCTISSITGFSPYFFNVWTYPRDSFRCGKGVTLIEQRDSFHQNYVQKLKAWLEWGYQLACENTQSLNIMKSIMTVK